MSRFRAKKESLTGSLFRGEGGIKRALRALLPGSAKRRQEDGHAQHAFKARLSLTKKGPFWVLFVSGEGGI